MCEDSSGRPLLLRTQSHTTHCAPSAIPPPLLELNEKCASAAAAWGAQARPYVEKLLAGQRKFRAVDAAIGRDGLKVVFLLRLSPLFPFSLGNYALGLSSVRLLDYVGATLVGILPGARGPTNRDTPLAVRLAALRLTRPGARQGRLRT